jgi:hypothetical protein
MDEGRKSDALKGISIELAEQGNWQLAEKTGLEIPLIFTRQKCWRSIAKDNRKERCLGKAMEQLKQLQSNEARLFYLKGWVETVNERDADSTCLQEALSQLACDSESIEMLLQKHALHEVFFGTADWKKIDRLNHILNIQWALDIAAQFPKEGSSARLSTNLNTWLHEITDEDDRVDIELWAERVAKGKITEEEFGERVRGIE